MPDLIIKDRVWVKNQNDLETRYRGEVVVVHPRRPECIVLLDNGIHIRTPTSLVELRESHE